MIPCHIVKDLLPSYVDDVLHADTKSDVDRHLRECEACRRELAEMSGAVAEPEPQTPSEEREVRYLQKIRTKTRVMIVGAAAAVTLVCAALVWLVAVGVPANQADIAYSTRMENGQWLIDVELLSGQGLVVRTEAVVVEDEQTGGIRFAGYELKPYKLPIKAIAGSSEFMFGYEMNGATDSGFYVKLQFGDKDVIFWPALEQLE